MRLVVRRLCCSVVTTRTLSTSGSRVDTIGSPPSAPRASRPLASAFELEPRKISAADMGPWSGDQNLLSPASLAGCD